MLLGFSFESFNQAHEFDFSVISELFLDLLLPVSWGQNASLDVVLDKEHFDEFDVVVEDGKHIRWDRRILLVNAFDVFVRFDGAIEKSNCFLVVFPLLVYFSYLEVQLCPFIEILDIIENKILFHGLDTLNQN